MAVELRSAPYLGTSGVAENIGVALVASSTNNALRSFSSEDCGFPFVVGWVERSGPTFSVLLGLPKETLKLIPWVLKNGPDIIGS